MIQNGKLYEYLLGEELLAVRKELKERIDALSTSQDINALLKLEDDLDSFYAQEKYKMDELKRDPRILAFYILTYKENVIYGEESISIDTVTVTKVLSILAAIDKELKISISKEVNSNMSAFDFSKTWINKFYMVRPFNIQGEPTDLKDLPEPDRSLTGNPSVIHFNLDLNTYLQDLKTLVDRLNPTGAQTLEEIKKRRLIRDLTYHKSFIFLHIMEGGKLLKAKELRTEHKTILSSIAGRLRMLWQKFKIPVLIGGDAYGVGIQSMMPILTLEWETINLIMKKVNLREEFYFRNWNRNDLIITSAFSAYDVAHRKTIINERVKAEYEEHNRLSNEGKKIDDTLAKEEARQVSEDSFISIDASCLLCSLYRENRDGRVYLDAIGETNKKLEITRVIRDVRKDLEELVYFPVKSMPELLEKISDIKGERMALLPYSLTVKKPFMVRGEEVFDLLHAKQELYTAPYRRDGVISSFFVQNKEDGCKYADDVEERILSLEIEKLFEHGMDLPTHIDLTGSIAMQFNPLNWTPVNPYSKQK